MTQASVVRDRLVSWYQACDAWGFVIDPPLSAAVLDELDEGVVQFRACRTVRHGRRETLVTLTVLERWSTGSDPHGDRRLESEGCFLEALSWHLQVGAEAGALSAERIDVILDADETHPRVHRHPYGHENSVRLAVELPPPQQWLYQLNATLGESLDAD